MRAVKQSSGLSSRSFQNRPQSGVLRPARMAWVPLMGAGDYSGALFLKDCTGKWERGSGAQAVEVVRFEGEPGFGVGLIFS
jgi:hypothetical protein